MVQAGRQLSKHSSVMFHNFVYFVLIFYAGFRSRESFLPHAFVTQNACMIPPNQSPKMHSNMLIKVLQPHPLSMQTANGGSNKQSKIEQQRLTILAVTR